MPTLVLRFAFAAAVAVLALLVQLAINPFVAPDTYQVFLGAVALSVIRGGTASGLVTLALSGAAKYVFFLQPAGAHSAARLALFLAIGVIICLIGGSLHRSQQHLAAAHDRVRQLTGLLPICASCKRIRAKDGAWCPIEIYIASHSEAEFSHGLCPECIRSLYPELKQNQGIGH
jgi:K+-sensing histidine kinase KdpD